jgi:translation elongation factor EF-Ts
MDGYNPTLEEIDNLKKITGFGRLDCKKALKDSNGNFKIAQEILNNKRSFNVLIQYKID